MANEKIREQLRVGDIKHWQLADKLNIAESTLCKRLRKELSDEEKQKTLAAIEELKRGE